MHVSIGMSSAAFMVQLTVDVCVCVYVCGRVCAYVHVNSSWKSVLVIKLLVDNCQPNLLLCSAYLQCLLFEYSHQKKKKSARVIACLLVSRSILLHRNWPVELQVNVRYSH